MKKSIISALLLTVVIILLFGRTILLSIYGYFTVIRKKEMTLTEKVFFSDLIKKHTFNVAYRTPSSIEDYQKIENEYGIVAEFKEFPSLNGKKDSLNKIAFEIAKKAYKEVNQRDTTIFVRYKITFWGKEEMSFIYTVRELDRP